MGLISSINFKKSSDFQVFHNSTIRPNYAIGGEIEYTIKGYEALKLKQEIIEQAKEIYFKTCKARNKAFQAKSYEWSAVCNIKPETTMQDLENLAKHFNEKYGFQCYQIAIHRDEGHINEQGQKEINHHAHLEFITLDKETGKNRFRRELITPKVLREMQTEVAKILQMQRGQDKRLSRTKRIEPRDYARMKEEEKKAKRALQKENTALLLTIREQKEIIEQARKSMIQEGGYTKEDYRKLSDLKKSIKERRSREDLETIIHKITDREITIKMKQGLFRRDTNVDDKIAEYLQDARDTITQQEQLLSTYEQRNNEILNYAIEQEKHKLQEEYQRKYKELQEANDNLHESMALQYRIKYSEKEKELEKREQDTDIIALQQQNKQLIEQNTFLFDRKTEFEMRANKLIKENERMKEVAKTHLEAQKTQKEAMQALETTNHDLIAKNAQLEQENTTLKEQLARIPQWIKELEQKILENMQSLWNYLNDKRKESMIEQQAMKDMNKLIAQQRNSYYTCIGDTQKAHYAKQIEQNLAHIEKELPHFAEHYPNTYKNAKDVLVLHKHNEKKMAQAKEKNKGMGLQR